MLITRHHDSAPEQAPGWRVDCLANAQQGGGVFEIWRLFLAVGATSPWLTSAAPAAVLVMAGSGTVRLASGPYRFSAPCTLAVASHAEYQFVNLGALELQLIVVRGIAPGIQAQVVPADGAGLVVSSN